MFEITNHDDYYSSASDLLESHALENDKREDSVMERSASFERNSVEIGDITETPDSDYTSTSAILYYCKSKILRPYLKLLTVMGLRVVIDTANSSRWTIYLSHLHSVQVTIFIVLGYFLQYMACFRRDRGFCYKLVPLALTSSLEYETYKQVCYGNVALTYVGPSLLHFIGFAYSLYLFRISDNEQLQNLMERVFLLSSYAPQGTLSANPKKLLRVLWFFIFLSVLWMCLSLSSVNMMMAEGVIIFKWMENSTDEVKLVLKILLIFCTLVQDMVQATIITSYCLQAQLLRAHLMYLRERLLNRSITPLNWMREIAEFRKLLRYLNEQVSWAVCALAVVSGAWAAAGALWLLSLDRVDSTEPIRGVSLLNVLLWLAAAIVPFVQAARLSAEGARSQWAGHELCVRPPLDCAREDVCTALVFASSLDIRAELFHYPIMTKYLYLVLTLCTIVLFALGMCHYLQ